MTYERPSYTELKTRIAADLAAMPAVLRDPLSVAWAQACHGQHGYLDWIDKQCSPLTCDLERLYDWAALYGVDRLLATPASGMAMATGNPGAQLLAGHLLRGPNSLDYTVQSAVTLGNEPTPVQLRCTSTGRAGNLAAGQVLTLVDPALGVASTAAVGNAGMSGGEEDESTEAWRQRVADEWRVVASRGARSGKDEDYVAWAKSAHASVTGALVQRHTLGMGSVIVRPICNDLLNRMPTQAVLDAVAAMLLNTAPATADWRVTAPLRCSVQIAIKLGARADTSANRDAIYAALHATVLEKSIADASLTRAEISAAINTVTLDYELVQPTATITAGPGEVLVLNPITWL